MDNKPLWLPEGSIRSILTLAIAGTACYMAIMGKLIPEWFEWSFNIVIVFYFGQKYLDKYFNGKDNIK